jgi:hypothetical protein
MARMHRKLEHTPEDKARLQAIRDHFHTARPSLDELVASGEYSEPVQHGVTLDASPLVHVDGGSGWRCPCTTPW